MWSSQFDRRTPFAQQQTMALATLCLVEMARRQREPAWSLEGLDSFRQRLWSMLERIANDPYAAWSISRLAKEAHFSLPHFSRCFRRVVRQTPRQYLVAVRLRAAADEIATKPSQPIKEVAERAGYTTVHAFTHAFKRIFGVSPGAYRRRPLKL